jgi:hypothetical protein
MAPKSLNSCQSPVKKTGMCDDFLGKLRCDFEVSLPAFRHFGGGRAMPGPTRDAPGFEGARGLSVGLICLSKG